MLQKSLDAQKVGMEKIFINNANAIFSSAAAALNYGASVSGGDIVIFAHQDIELKDKTAIIKIIDHLKHSTDCVLGLAGSAEDGLIYTNMKHGIDRQYAGEKQIDRPVKAEVLDESLVALKRDLFMKYSFDEQTCSNWHLYAADLCLTLGSHNIHSYVLPIEAYHLSRGNKNIDYYKNLLAIARKHHAHYPVIHTTCATTNTNLLKCLSFILYHIARITIKKHTRAVFQK